MKRIPQALKTCQECRKNMRRFRIVKGKIVCYQCGHKKQHILMSNHFFSLEKALNKEYEVYGFVSGNAIRAGISLPAIMAGRKVKLTLIQ